jgi:HD-GYP domain-containing protein (c-di-GMP phosphodiesterase class II)
VVSEHPNTRPILTLDDLAAPMSRRPERLHALTASELAVAFSQALDLAEGKQPGHAQRVCYIATMLADALGLEPAARAGVFFGALLHDAGVTSAAADLCRVAGVDEEAIFGPSPRRSPEELKGTLPFADLNAINAAVQEHPHFGAQIAAALELPEEVSRAITGHHQRWDGRGFPGGVHGAQIALESRIIAAADMAESVIAGETSSLAARRRFGQALAPYAGSSLDPDVVGRLFELAHSDEFWLGLYADDLPEVLAGFRASAEGRKSRRRVLRFAEAFADISDAKGGHTLGHSRRTADGAAKLAEALALDPGHIEMIRIAALLHDVGLLGVPARVMSKPDILSVTEMQLMRQHPSHSEMILQPLQGFEEVAFWISRHHERPDGKGYPDMLSGDDIPLESRILSVADVYAALTSERPHRGALSSKDARQILLGAAGSQLDPELARLFCTLI